MTIKRKTGDEAIIFHVPTTRRHVEVGFDLAKRFNGVDGVESIGTNYKRSVIRNPPIFQRGVPRTVDIFRSVGSLVIYLDGVKFTSWRDSEGSIPSGNGLIGGERRLILGGFEGNVVEYQKVELIPDDLDR